MERNIVMISIDKLVGFSNHPYKVIDDEAMDELCESVRTVGVLVPIIVRTVEDGRYEIISGHRRKRACEREGIVTIPTVVTKLSDDEAAILLVDSNLHRENILPSEKAYAYKLKLDAMKHQGKRDGTSRQLGVRTKSWTLSFAERRSLCLNQGIILRKRKKLLLNIIMSVSMFAKPSEHSAIHQEAVCMNGLLARRSPRNCPRKG